MHDGDALLVCAYDDREKCASLALEDAIPYAEILNGGVDAWKQAGLPMANGG